MKFEYDRNLFLKPVLTGKIVLFETFLPLEGEDVRLLFPIKKVIAVTSYGLDIQYKEKEDFTVVDGKLHICKKGKIHQTGIDEIYKKEPHLEIVISVDPKRCKRHFSEPRYFLYGEEATITSRQYAISYEHDTEWEDFLPTYQGGKVKRFLSLLENKKTPTLLFFGDSITAGCNSSGTEYGGKVKPFAESWPQMVFHKLEDLFGTKIKYVNTAIPGKNTDFALRTLDENVIKYDPDLLVLAFGMNDGKMCPEEHMRMINEIINKTKEAKPTIEIILIGTTIANNESDWCHDESLLFVNEYKKLNDPSVAVVDMTSMHTSLLKRKQFIDMTGNDVNHPNDFLARMYAITLLSTILKGFEA